MAELAEDVCKTVSLDFHIRYSGRETEKKETYNSNSSVGFPANTFNTIVLAINSISSGYFSRAADSAASASGIRPRCNSATAWPTVDSAAVVLGAAASSS